MSIRHTRVYVRAYVSSFNWTLMDSTQVEFIERSAAKRVICCIKRPHDVRVLWHQATVVLKLRWSDLCKVALIREF